MDLKIIFYYMVSLLDVCLPCRLPKSCESCGEESKYLRLTASTYDVVIVNQKGMHACFLNFYLFLLLYYFFILMCVNGS